MTVKVYGAPCSSTRKAKNWLANHGLTFVERNILKEPLTVQELQVILHRTLDGTDEIIATRSKVYKELDLDFDALSLQELITIIQKHPGLLRSPIIMDEKRMQVGYHDDEIRQFIPRKTREYEWLQLRLNSLRPAEL